MNALTVHRAGWLLIGLTVLPLLARSETAAPFQAEKLEWLVAVHDVRHAVHASRPRANGCQQSEAERSQ